MVLERLEVSAYVADGQLTLRLAGPLVNGTTARLAIWMQAHVPASARTVVLDLTEVPVVDAVGLGALLAARRRLDAGAAVLLTGAQPVVSRMLRRSGVDLALRNV